MRRLVILAAALAALTGCQAAGSISDGWFGGQPTLPSSDSAGLIGEMSTYRTAEEDTLPDVAHKLKVGFVELRTANPTVDVWLPGGGKELVVPTAHLLPDAPREGIVINLPEMRLYHFDDRGKATSYPIGVGRDGWDTPKGTTTVVRKKEKPTWYPPASIRREQPDLPKAVPPGPENPLGSHAIYLGWPAYLIHGTNEPLGVGRRVSHGCIRLYPEHIPLLYEAVAKGTPVAVVDQPLKWAWIGDDLYVEAHPTLAQADDIEEDREIEPVAAPAFMNEIEQEAAGKGRKLDRDLLERVLAERRGYPIRVTPSPPLIPWLDL